MKNGKGEVTA